MDLDQQQRARQHNAQRREGKAASDGPTGDKRARVHGADQPGQQRKQQPADMDLDVLAISSGLDSKGAVCEIYSPPRVVPVAGAAGLPMGWSLDLTTEDSQGRPWDFDQAEVRARCRKLVRDSKPAVIIGSPMCTWFSALQKMNRKHMDPLEWSRQRVRAIMHLAFAFELYEAQHIAGRLFVHEHPESADSWDQDVVINFRSRHPELFETVMDQCMYGLTTTTDSGDVMPARKPTKWLTNSGCVAARLSARCDGSHSHQPLVGGRASAAQVYPPELCRAIAAGLADQLRADAETADLEHRELYCVDSPMEPIPEVAKCDEDDAETTELNNVAPVGEWAAFDDLKGQQLDPDMVRAARAEEMKFLWDREVYEVVPVSECVETTGRRPLGLKWIDTNKGTQEAPKYRSRLVATEVRPKDKDPTFSATPPLETCRMLLAIAAQRNPHKDANPVKITVADVSRAHFYAKARRRVYVKLPPEDMRSQDKTLCGRLLRTWYGTLDAAACWGEEYAERMVAAGFRRGKSCPCLFYHPDRGIRVMVFGDDFMIVADQQGTDYTLDLLRGNYALSMVTTVGPAATEAKSVKFLNRTITLKPDGWEYAPDARLVEDVVKKMEMANAKPAPTPMFDPKPESVNTNELRIKAVWSNPPPALTADPMDELLEPDRKSMFVSMAAKLNYLAMDRVDIQFGTKELLRQVSAPTERDWVTLKRMVRYLVGVPRLVAVFRWRPLGNHLDVFCDANWARDSVSRKSTVGGVVLWSGQFVRSWSKTMSTIAMSSGESELAAVVRACAEALGLRSNLADLGIAVGIHVKSDATAAIGMVHRLGLGRVRHLSVGDLWVQERLRSGEIRISKWPGSENCSDQLTKPCTKDEIDRHTATACWQVPQEEIGGGARE